MSAGDADEAVRWKFCRLDFFATFLVKQKSREKKYTMSNYEKTINNPYNQRIVDYCNFFCILVVFGGFLY